MKQKMLRKDAKRQWRLLCTDRSGTKRCIRRRRIWLPKRLHIWCSCRSDFWNFHYFLLFSEISFFRKDRKYGSNKTKQKENSEREQSGENKKTHTFRNVLCTWNCASVLDWTDSGNRKSIASDAHSGSAVWFDCRMEIRICSRISAPDRARNALWHAEAVSEWNGDGSGTWNVWTGI